MPESTPTKRRLPLFPRCTTSLPKSGSKSFTASALAHQQRLDRAAALAAMRLHGTYHWLHGEHAKAQKLWRRSIAAAEALGSPYELAPTQLEVGSRTPEEALVVRARVLLSDLAARAVPRH